MHSLYGLFWKCLNMFQTSLKHIKCRAPVVPLIHMICTFAALMMLHTHMMWKWLFASVEFTMSLSVKHKWLHLNKRLMFSLFFETSCGLELCFLKTPYKHSSSYFWWKHDMMTKQWHSYVHLCFLSMTTSLRVKLQNLKSRNPQPRSRWKAKIEIKTDLEGTNSSERGSRHEYTTCIYLVFM